MPVVAGIDSSTQSCTIVLRDADTGETMASASAPHPPTTPPASEQHPWAWWDAMEQARVVAPGGPLLVAFHSGEEVRHLDDWWDQPVDLDFRFLTAARIAPLLEGAGFAIEATLTRSPYAPEHPTTRTYLLARRSPA